MGDFKNIWLFLPCLNEEENVAFIVKAILNLRINHLHIALIVDRSTDRTEAIADALHEQFPQTVFVLHRTPPGSRALAGKDAFLFCLERGADAIIEMDADFSHDPKYIPQMLYELSDPRVDVVLGSRFLPGGSDADRSSFRTFVSRLSGIVFRFMLGISLTDMGSGFKAYKRQALESIEPRNLFSKKGLAISMESIFRVLKNGHCVKEIPIIFKDRKFGTSKLSWKDFFEPIFISLKLLRSLGRFHEKTERSRNRVLSTSWWWGSVILTFLAVALPYWIWGIVGGARGWEALWRVPVAPNAVFDSYAYFQQICLLKAGIQTGAFGWFTWPLLGLIRVLPFASIPEIWILSRWVTTFLMMWIGAWCIRSMTGTSKRVSRWLIVCFWLSFLLVIGLRPGVFSWYLPFGFFGIGLMALAVDALRNDRWIKAGACSVAALFVSAIYPWFLIYGAIFLAAVWALRIVQSRPRWWIALITASALAACGFALLLASETASLRLPASFATYERNGVMFSFMPLISNTVVACALWLGLLMSGLSRWRAAGRMRTVELLGWFWIIMLAAWLSTPLVGVFFQSDHFIIIVAMLAWVNAALYVTPTSAERSASTRFERSASIAIAIFSSLFLLYVLTKGFLIIGKFETFTIHLSIWLCLAWSAWSHWLHLRGADMRLRWKRSRWSLLAICLFFGTIGLCAVVIRGMKEIPDLERRIPAIVWMGEHVPLDEAVCSDPVNAGVYGAHNARQTYPEESNMVLMETDDVLHQRLMTIGAAYDAAAAGDEGRYPYLINGLRTNTCAQFVKVSRLLERFHVSRESIDSFLGCLQARADAYEREVMAVIRARQVDPSAFRATCPWVIIPDDRKAYWNLPGSYEEIRVDDHTSIWHAI